jgi:CBS domain-containing protein
MSRDVVTIAPDATLDDALAAMSTANVGRCRCCGTED